MSRKVRMMFGGAFAVMAALLSTSCFETTAQPTAPPVTPQGPSGPELRLGSTPAPSTTIDLGDVDPTYSGTSTVRVINTQKSPVTILSFNSSCECTSVTGLPVTIAAGESRDVAVTTDMSHEPDFRGSLAIEVQLMAETTPLATITVSVSVR